MKGLLERRGVGVSFMWGLSEATLFFLVPDIPVGGVALFSLRRGRVQWSLRSSARLLAAWRCGS